MSETPCVSRFENPGSKKKSLPTATQIGQVDDHSLPPLKLWRKLFIVLFLVVWVARAKARTSHCIATCHTHGRTVRPPAAGTSH